MEIWMMQMTLRVIHFLPRKGVSDLIIAVIPFEFPVQVLVLLGNNLILRLATKMGMTRWNWFVRSEHV
jgi:hypothetical protein